MSNAIVNGLAGAGAGIVAQIITYPIQTVNTRQQTERIVRKDTATATTTATTKNCNYATGNTLLQIIQVIRSEGWGGLFSGLKPSLFGTAASQGIYYYFYQVFRNKAEAIAVARRKKGLGDGTLGMLSWLSVAALAGNENKSGRPFTVMSHSNSRLFYANSYNNATQTLAERKIVEAKRVMILKEASEINSTDLSLVQAKLSELDSIRPLPYGTLDALIKRPLNERHGKYAFHVDAARLFPSVHYDYWLYLQAREVHEEAGIRGFCKGIIPTLIMVCNPSIQFMIYECLVKRLRAKRAAVKNGSTDVTALEVFFFGALAKLGATVATYPLLVVKSRLQAKQETGGNVALKYTGTLDAIVKMIRFEGLPAFYKGMSTKIVQSVFAASVLFMVKEELVKTCTRLVDKRSKITLNLAK
ncbi:hypothetical protein Scep_024049 [Stephania cephalantha]|uniref:Peroxisomal nicotinamide adenine dinucleotide carrier n=1 Tax=Stephania cephalantha TaxID=152367 RepID=A0AAP0HY11_9MAGN